MKIPTCGGGDGCCNKLVGEVVEEVNVSIYVAGTYRGRGRLQSPPILGDEKTSNGGRQKCSPYISNLVSTFF